MYKTMTQASIEHPSEACVRHLEILVVLPGAMEADAKVAQVKNEFAPGAGNGVILDQNFLA